MRLHRGLFSMGCCLGLLVLFTGCQSMRGAQGNSASGLYSEKIKDWQKRIKREGWSEAQVDAVLGQCLSLVTYRMELDDHWDTPAEFINRGFQGDCEDIAVFMMGTLKRVEYPFNVRVLAIKGLFGGHAALKVELPDGSWKLYDTTPMTLRVLDPKRAQQVVEFDEKVIVFLSENQR